MILGKKTDKETVKILLQENKRLKVKNQQLNESLDGLQRYKEEYESLIEELNRVKESYAEKTAEFERIEKEYKKELDKVKLAAGKA